MKLADLFKIRAASLEDPNVPLGAWGVLANALSVWGGGQTSAGVDVSETSAMNYSAVWRAVTLIAGSIATAPIHLFSEGENDTRTKAKTGAGAKLYKVLRSTPNPQMTAWSFKFAIQANALLWGAGYALIQRDRAGRVVALWPLLSANVKPNRDKDGALVYEHTVNGNVEAIAPADILVIPFATLDGVTPLSPLGAYRQATGLGLATERFGANFFGNGAHPGGFFSTDNPPSDPKKRKELEDSARKMYGGENSHRAMLALGPLKWNPISVPPEDAQFLQTRKFQLSEIARVFGVPPHMLADLERSTNNNIEQQSLEYLRDCMIHWATRWKEEIDTKISPAGYSVDFDLDYIQQADFATMMTGFGTGRQWGFFTINQVLQKLKMNPVGPEGDVRMVPVNMQNAKVLAGQTEAPAAPAPAPPDTNSTSTTARDKAARAHRHTFRDAVGRIVTRDKRSEQYVAQAMLPVLTSLAASLSPHELAPEFEAFLADYAGGIAKRALTWTPEQADSITDTEFERAIAAITDRAAKETK